MRLAKRDRDVYRWETDVLAPVDRSRVDLATARGIVSHVWSVRGLSAPPLVEEKRIGGAYANRQTITISDRGVATWVVLHEMAHSMDQSIEVSMGFYEDRPAGESLEGSCHDENWLGIYLDLLNDFMPPSFNKLYMMKTLHDRRIQFAMCPVIRCR